MEAEASDDKVREAIQHPKGPCAQIVRIYFGPKVPNYEDYVKARYT